MPLRLFTASQLSPLLDHLAEGIARDPLPPRDDEIIVVQSQGMRRWLTLQLADRFGCAGSVVLPFPATFVREVEGRLAPDRSARGDADPFAREVLRWRIDAILRALPPGEPVFHPLHTYLSKSDERARFGLASQIAARFDDYQLFRADMLEHWEAGEETGDSSHAAWQAALWRRLCAESDGSPHLAARLRRAIERLRREPPVSLPARVSVFGVSALPPLFVDLLAALAEHVPVSIYTAAPAAEASHPIAAVFALQSREFIGGLARRGAALSTLASEARPTGGLLQALQRELAMGSAGDSPITIDRGDASLSVHNAHGDFRQVEIIRDQLLAALQADRSLRPHDILFLVPDAAEWAPLVDAVFGDTTDRERAIRYHVADRPLRCTQPAAEAMVRLLALEGGRFERSEVLAFLSHPLARKGAGLTESQVEWIEGKLDPANVRWGYDALARKSLGLPAYEDASWRAGLDRLLLGVAVGRSNDAVLGVLPESGDTTGDPESLATFADWVDRLATTLGGWRAARTLAEWSLTLLDAVDQFLRADSGEQQVVAELQATIRGLAVLGAVARHAESVPFAVVRDWLEGALDDDGFGSGFLKGGMTVAALKPMRSLPFKVIAVAGLDDGVFPRRDRRTAFDLLEHDRRAGDRDLRSDDRQLFLDLLLAAQDRLILAYAGRDVSDNSPRAPSVVLDELLDHLDRRSGGKARKALVVEHPLQPFSMKYFGQGGDASLFTYSRAQAFAAQARARGEGSEAPFVTEPLPRPGLGAGSPFELTLRDLGDCWTNPSKYFCQRVLGFSLDGDEMDVSDDEIFTPDHMLQGLIRSKMLGAALSGTRDERAERRRFLADGTLPPQALGEAWHRQLSAQVAAVLDEVPNDVVPVALPFTIEGMGWRLKGRLEGIRGSCRYVVRASTVRAEHRVRAWVEHLAMCAARESGVAGLPGTTVLIGKKCHDELPQVPNALARLAQLVEAARDCHAAPLPFFAEAGWAWLSASTAKPKKGKKGGAATAPKDPRTEAVRAFHREAGMFGGGGDSEDPYVILCFRARDPMAERWEEFERLCLTLFGAWTVPEGGA